MSIEDLSDDAKRAIVGLAFGLTNISREHPAADELLGAGYALDLCGTLDVSRTGLEAAQRYLQDWYDSRGQREDQHNPNSDKHAHDQQSDGNEIP